MFLTYGDLAKLFPKKRGIQGHELYFHTVATISTVTQPRGIFIPCTRNSGELRKAIENGAIATLWDKDVEVPRYTPNHFPIFFTNDLLKGLMDMMELYIENSNKSDQIQNNRTNFLFSDELCLKDNNSTYNIAEMAEKIQSINDQIINGKEGTK